MQIQVSGHQVEVTPALRSHVETRVERIERHFDHLTSLNVVLTVEKLQHRAEGTLTGSGCVLHAFATETDMYASIDVMMDKLLQQLRKHRDKHADRNQAKVRDARYA
ncbi:MAG TPA: ribosome-associated translation inhibitor RaiA [Rhodanobacteraceae bacterium]|nr:ribosome-associated translation inhibitor RaiA [Rhodanobacteraceae bacterium]